MNQIQIQGDGFLCSHGAGGGLPALLAPTNLAATGFSYSQIDLTWTLNSVTESRVIVTRSATLNGVYSDIATLATGATSYSDTGLQENQTWFYKVRVERDLDSTSATSSADDGTSTLFQPPQAANLKLWLRSDSADLLAINDNGHIASWADQSGNGNDLIQLTGGNQPVFHTSGLNGYPTVSFDGTQFMERANVASANTRMTFIAIFSFDSGAGGPHTVFKNGNGAGFVFLKNGGNRIVSLRGVADCTDAAATANFEVWAARTTAAPVTSLRVDGAAQGLTSSGSTPNAPDTAMHLGCFQTNQFNHVGSIVQIFYWDTDLSTSDVQLVEAYLTAKYF